MNTPNPNNEISSKLHALDILNEMRHAGLESLFICSLMENCQRYEGVRDLMEMWFTENDSAKRDKIIADLQESLDDITVTSSTKVERSFLQYNDLETVRKDILEFKNYLREETDKMGGISQLAKLSGIPQPSLSRFFSSGSMPRRTTLYKIAKALDIPESRVGFKWTS